MGKARKTRKFAAVKRMISPKDPRVKQTESEQQKKKKKNDEEEVKHVDQVSSALFFQYNTQLGPPYYILVDTNFINFSIKNKLDLFQSMMDCLYAKCIPCITDCVMGELEKMGTKYRVALRIARDERFQRLPCMHKGTYADDCLVNRVSQHKCYIVATCDRDLKRRIRKVPGVPIMYITQHRYSIERMPDAYGEPAKSFDPTGRRLYLSACAGIGVTPVSYFLRHIQDKDLILRHHGLGPKGVKAVAIALVSNTTVVTLDLHDNNIGDDGGKYIAEMVKENCYIASLDLSSNKIGRIGCMAVCDMLNNSGIIQDLNLSNNFLGDKDAEVLADTIKVNGHLIDLNLSGNRFCEEGGVLLGPSITANDSIEILNLSWNQIRRRGAIAIAAGLKSNCTLKVLDLSWNGFEDDGARALGDAFRGNNTLTELNIRNNRISTVGAAHIARGLEGNNTLEILKIGQNPIQTAGAHSVLSAVRTKSDSAIHTLYLEDIYLDDDFFVLLKNINERKPVKVVGRGRPSERTPLHDVKQYINNNYDRWFEVFGAYDPDGCGLISKAQFIQGLKEVNLTFDKGQMAWLCISLTEDRGSQISYKKPAENIKKKIPSAKVSPKPATPVKSKPKKKSR